MAAGYEEPAMVGLHFYLRHGKWPRLALNPDRKPGARKWLIVGDDGKPPLWPAAALGEKGTPNHVLLAIIVGVFAGLPGYRQLLLDWWAEERRRGHMLNEFMSASHWQHFAAAVAAVLIIALREGWTRVANEAIAWFARDTAFNLRFWEPNVKASMGKGSTICPHARTWGGWRSGEPVSPDPVTGLWSPMRDELMRYAQGGPKPRGNYDPGLDREALDLLMELPWHAYVGAAQHVDLSKVAVIAPVFEKRVNDSTVNRWWDPPRQVTGTPPTVYAAGIVNGREALFYNSRQAWPAGADTRGARAVGRAV
jgi:hypothetical protein